jgi:hypothetical protein
LSPSTTDQELPVSGDPVNQDRTGFLLKAKLPQKLVRGEWPIKVVRQFLAGTSWKSSNLSTNPNLR